MVELDHGKRAHQVLVRCCCLVPLNSNNNVLRTNHTLELRQIFNTHEPSTSHCCARTSAAMAALGSSASSASSICSSVAPAALARFFSTLGFRPASS